MNEVQLDVAGRTRQRWVPDALGAAAKHPHGVSFRHRGSGVHVKLICAW